MEKLNSNDNKFQIANKVNSIIEEIELLKKKILLNEMNIRKGIYHGLNASISKSKKITIESGIFVHNYYGKNQEFKLDRDLIIDCDEDKPYIVFMIDISNNIRDFFCISESVFKERRDDILLIGKVIFKKGIPESIDLSDRDNVDLELVLSLK